MRPTWSTFVVLAPVLAAPIARAGDVSATVNGGTLKLVGTAASDDIVVSQDMVANPKQFRIHPNAGTTVNGSGSDVLVNGVTKDIDIALGDGTDVAHVEKATLPDDLRIHGGTGSLSFLGDVISIKGDAVADSGGGTFSFVLRTTKVRGDVKFAGAGGMDLLDFDGPVLVRGDVKATLGAGIDMFSINSSRVEGTTKVDGGADPDNIAFGGSSFGDDVSVTDPDGATVLQAFNSDFAKRFKSKTASGMDVTTFLGNQFIGSVSLATGDGGDTVTCSSCEFSSTFKLACGSGGDFFQIATTQFERAVDLQLGDGANVVSASSAHFGSNLRYRGGPGLDTFSAVNLIVRGDAKFEFGDAPTMSTNTLALTNVLAKGDVSITGGSHDDLVVLSAGVIHGTVKAALGAGTNSFIGGGSAAGNIRVVTGDGDDSVQLATGFRVAKDADIRVGGGNNTVSVDHATIGDDLIVRAGSGNDTFSSSATVVGDKTDIDLGGGTNTQ